MYSKRNICLIPTYVCNANCPFCYARELQKRFKKDMDWKTFIKIVETCIKAEKNEVSFLGGEPTIWPHIDQAVSFLKERGIQVSFFTNGITYSKVAPNCVLINIYNFFNSTIRKSIKKTIYYYKSQGVEIGLRYNLVSSSATKEDESFIKFAMSLGDYISISPAIPYVLSRSLGNRIFKLVQSFRKKGRTVKIARAIPVCLFNAEQFRYLRKECSLRVGCYSEKNVVINPNGRTVFPCVNIPMFTKDLFKEDLKRINADFKKFFKCLGEIFPFSQCQNCEYALDNRCQAGCLGMRSTKAINTAIKKMDL
jgi:MoaA/NifB/PqqE/SkfB family radical SAM enzyme